MVDSVVLQNVKQLGRCPEGSHYAKSCEQRVPNAQSAFQIETRPALHVILSAENDYHVESTKVKAYRPILGHPCPGVLMDELLLEVEHVGVVSEANVVVAPHGEIGRRESRKRKKHRINPDFTDPVSAIT